jgi:hypothetical protein
VSSSPKCKAGLPLAHRAAGNAKACEADPTTSLPVDNGDCDSVASSCGFRLVPKSDPFNLGQVVAG